MTQLKFPDRTVSVSYEVSLCSSVLSFLCDFQSRKVSCLAAGCSCVKGLRQGNWAGTHNGKTWESN